MSKAFTDEEALTAPVPGRRVERAAPGQERPITPAGHHALLAQAAALRASLAGTAGDERARLEHRLALAEASLSSVRVVAPGPVDGEVRFGSEVELRWDDGRAQRLVLLGEDELELPGAPGVARVSVQAPLGRALVGQREGDEIELQRPRGAVVAVIVAVR
jgi:transcription elongation GreA/GreB family factor